MLNVEVVAKTDSANADAANNGNPLRALLEESCLQRRGVMLLVNGLQVAVLVTAVTDDFVTAKSQSLGNIVIRIDRIDGAAGFSQEVTEK